MDDFNRTVSIIFAFIILSVIYFMGVCYVIQHDENILESHRTDVKFQYFIYSENRTNQEKYDMAKSICDETFSNESIYYNEMWSPRLPFWDVEGHIEHEINRCECALLGID